MFCVILCLVSMNNKKTKKLLKKVWCFIWDDNSIWSWIVNIILAVIIIKFIIYPVLGLALGTSYPIVAVVSGSMEHKIITHEAGQIPNVCGHSFDYEKKLVFDEYWNLCGDWYKDKNITKEEFKNFKFSNGFNTGDIMILGRSNPDKIKLGDVIVFESNSPDPIIHRVVQIIQIDGKYYFTTKGDHNEAINNGVGEEKISEDRVLGKANIRVPYLGYVKIGFVKMINYIRGLFI